MLFPVDATLMLTAEDAIRKGKVLGVAKHRDGSVWLELESPVRGTTIIPSMVIRASANADGSIQIQHSCSTLRKDNKPCYHLGVAVAILGETLGVAKPTTPFPVDVVKVAPALPARSDLTDLTHTVTGQVNRGSQLPLDISHRPPGGSPGASAGGGFAGAHSGDPAGTDGTAWDPGTSWGDVDADVVRAYLKEEGISDKLTAKVIAARRRDLTPGLTALVPGPRRFRGQKEVLALALKAFLHAKNLFLVGAKSSGKTTLIHCLAWVFNLPLYELSGNLQTESADMRGDRTLEPDAEIKQAIVKYQLGLLTEAMQNGGVCHLDEFPAIREGVAMMVNGPADWRRSIDIPGYGPIIAHPEFRLALGGNKGYAGCFSPNQATLDRNVVIAVNPVADPTKIIRENSKSKDDKVITKLADLYKKLVEMLKVGQIRSADCLSIRGLIDAADLIADDDGDVSAQFTVISCIANKMWDDDFGDFAQVEQLIKLSFK